ncbi:hypothetical protein P4V86_16960 [Brevibacillus laterosporus]|uniref:Uncharacterized protein n=1 Tax=Brevibacillus laterosporus TaxID=1465 RepID=A0AAP8U593_BRELA|nr:hypothetical protein [Brevibacillus laterosporus]ATO49844.1 hypothetical protein BrL25_12565 [Brevibacillus laterosporus DSM 25]MBG9800429.1 hypothetical protein [Brevibacillus laterosporus]MBG9801578.1 hypothetical protein [Brevibacillus laterosporus]MDN9010723.1 hypothetical protein [Brevibacillus laterosporus]MDO0941714.1 hypothetical protein [Brevibacillus laterosporus]
MSNRVKFLSTISEHGFDINKPFDIRCSGNENGVTLSILIQGDEKNHWNSDIRLAAIKQLIWELDIKSECNADYNIFQKYMLTILDSIGNVISWATPYDEERNIEKVKRFIEDSLVTKIVEDATQEGLIDQYDDDDIDFSL